MANRFVLSLELGNPAPNVVSSKLDHIQLVSLVDEPHLKVNLAVSSQTDLGTLYAYDKEAGVVVFLDGYILSDSALSAAQIIDVYLNSLDQLRCILPGIYNIIVINLNSMTVDVLNDGMGQLPCYFFLDQHRLIFANSLFLLKQVQKLDVSPQGFGETYMLGWTIGEKTIFDQLFRTLAGMHYQFSISENVKITKHRLSENWTGIIRENVKDVMAMLYFCWQQAVRRCIDSFAPPYGMMLSGGLDSRMVLGELAKYGPVIACTHGNPDSQEYHIASQVAQQCGAEWLPNPMNDALQFESLELEDVHQNTDLLFNLIWQSSLCLLSQRGVSAVATGCLGGALLGGSYYISLSKRQRFLTNFALSLGLPISLAMSAEEGNRILSRTLYAEAEKRLRGYSALLKPEYQKICWEALENINAEIDNITESYLHDGIVSGWQVFERFQCEHRDRKLVFAQEMIIRASAEALVPTMDRDYLNCSTRLDPRLKFDHHLYYQFFNRYYPDLAKIPVPNLHGSINVPQFVIEARRAANRISSSVSGIRSNHNWVNFSNWILNHDYLAQYRVRFTENEDVFDVQNVNRYFDLVKEGKRSVYDGNETLSFLNTAMLVNPGVVKVTV